LLAPAGIRSVIPTEPDAIYDLSAGWEIGPLSAIPGGPDVGWRETQEPVELSLVRVGGDIRPPKKVKHVSPIYPDAARYAHIEGDVKLQAVIDAEGNVTRVTITRSVPLLDRAAIEAVRQWKYEPTRLNGVAVPILLSVEVSFRLGPG
jgi:TonB family protein